jgi:hypothetical protein
MATNLLVTDGIRQGERLLRALDSAPFPVTTALWYLSAETWRYVLATPVVDRDGPREAYRQVNEVMRSNNIPMSLSDVTVVSPKDPLVALIGAAVHTGPTDVSGVRFTANTINHVFIEDAYIYRAA